MYSFNIIVISTQNVTTWSTDIEDKGTSGETFLAAVEYLEQEKPDIAIFENVDKAPWEKMQVITRFGIF